MFGDVGRKADEVEHSISISDPEALGPAITSPWSCGSQEARAVEEPRCFLSNLPCSEIITPVILAR